MSWSEEDLRAKGYVLQGNTALRPISEKHISSRNVIIINKLESRGPDGGTSEPPLTTLSVMETTMANDDCNIPAPRKRQRSHSLQPARYSGTSRDRRERAALLEAQRQSPPENVLNLLTYPTRIADARIVAHCTIPGNPGVKDRPRFVKASGAVFTPKATKESQREIGWSVKQAMRELLHDNTSAFGLRLLFYVKNGQRKDLDNMTKVVCDGITGIAWADDAQVKELMAWSYEDPAHPRTEILIYKLGFAVKTYHVCEVCHKRFYVYPSWLGRPYCSRACFAFAQRNRVLMTCTHCGTQLERIPARAKKTQEAFCSIECRTAHTTQELECAQCHVHFRRPNSLIHHGQNAFCSIACQRQYRQDHRVSPPVGQCQKCGGPTTKKKSTICFACRYPVAASSDTNMELQIVHMSQESQGE